MFAYLALIEENDEKLKFEIIYEEYKNLMYYAANRILGDTRDSEDIVHEAFLKVIEILDKIPTAKCPQTRSLVVTIVERKAIDLYRKRRKNTMVPLDEENIHTSVSPDNMMEGIVIAQALAGLSPKYRQLLLLKYDNGYSEHEIAQITGMTQANVKKTIQRAKAALQTILDEMEDTYETD